MNKNILYAIILAVFFSFTSCSLFQDILYQEYSNYHDDVGLYIVNVQDIRSFYRLSLDLADRVHGNVHMVAFGTPFKKDDVEDVCKILGMAYNAIENGWKFSCKLKQI